MKQITNVTTLKVTYRGSTVGRMALTDNGRGCTFEYDPAWMSGGFSISPLELPLKKGVFIAKPLPFDGNFGVFEDSMPDGYGRYLLHKTLLQEGIDDSLLGILDRLSLVGTGGMGALCYHPENKLPSEPYVSDLDLLQKKALEVLLEKQEESAPMLLYNSGNSGGARPKAIFKDDEGHWLVKFRHTYDPKDIGKQEYLYNQIAKEAGIDVPDFRLINDKYFASRRFDLTPEGERLHVATAGGLLGISLINPVLDYSNLLALTGYLTQDEKAVEEMYRRMIFNYLTGNRDDHCKNFSFLVDHTSEGFRWRLAPAYDLTYCATGYNGEHATSVNGKGQPVLSDFLYVGTSIKLSEIRCRQMIEQLIETTRPIARFEIK